ncbi:hypothetical protein BGX24_008647 [Mortierella sp. AD032]|nr:hypothetical protein BGX24_008647 [Mortierella sp. AD032]
MCSLNPPRIAAIPGVTLDVVVTGPAVVASPPPSALRQIAQQAAQIPKHNSLLALQSHPWTSTSHFTIGNNVLHTLNHHPALVPLTSRSQLNDPTTRAHKRVLNLNKVKMIIGKIAVCVDLDMLHAKGDGRPQDFRKALECYLKTVQQGQTQALISVGDLFLDGQAIQQSPTIAMGWYLKAAYLGDNNARYKIDQLWLELPRLFSSSRVSLLEGSKNAQQDKHRDTVTVGNSSLGATIVTAEGLASSSSRNDPSDKQEEVKQLEEPILGNQKEMKQLQQRSLDQLAMLQSRVQAVLTQIYELHEYPISRLFVVLPQDPSGWDTVNPFSNKFRLYFLCECGEHTKSISSKTEISHDIHFAKHEGYEVVRPLEFFHIYGPYVLTILKMLKVGVSAAGVAVPAISHLVKLDAIGQATAGLQQLRDNIEPGIDHVIDWMDKVFVNEGEAVDEFAKQMEKKEALEGANLRKLDTFLKDKDGNKVLGNLYRIVTDEGHVKWVCIDHYRMSYQESSAKEFLRMLDYVGGSFSENIGRVEVRIQSRVMAEQFFSALGKARFVYELDIDLGWACAASDLEALEDALKKSRVSILQLHLRQQFRPSLGNRFLSTSARYEALFRLRELPTVKMIHIVLPKELVKLACLQPKTPSHFCTLSLELATGFIEGKEFARLAEALKTNSTLTTLDLKHNSIGDNGAKTLAEALKTNSTLTTLYLQGNSIGDSGAQALAEALKSNSTLNTLDLQGNLIWFKGLLSFSEALEANSTLTTLDLRGNKIGDNGAKALAEALETNSTLTTLDLQNKSIGDDGVQALSEALKTNSTLTTLDLASNLIGTEGAKALAKALKINSTLTTLNLQYNSIGSDGAKALAEALKNNSALTILDLCHNSIGSDGAKALAEILETNSTLTTLDLRGNKIGDNGAKALAEALETNSTLTTLDLKYNSIDDNGAQALSEALKTNSILATLYLSSNPIGDNRAQALSGALRTNLTLTTLNLKSNPIGDNKAQALSEALKTNSILTTLRLHSNKIGYYGAHALSEALKTNSTLTTLHLSSNPIGDNGAQALSEALRTNFTLTTLKLWNCSIECNGVQALSEALKTNSTLTTLDLNSNEIGEYGAHAVSEALKTNSTLTTLSLANNLIRDSGVVALFEALKTNSTLNTLKLWENWIGCNGAQALSEALRTNSTLIDVNLQANLIGDNGAKALSEALKINSILTTLDLYSNRIGANGAQALSEALRTNSTLTNLNLRKNLIGDSGAHALHQVSQTTRCNIQIY